MKEIRVLSVKGGLPGFPQAERNMVKIEKLKGRIEIVDPEGCGMSPFMWRFETEDYGLCYGHTNVFSVVSHGHFNIQIPRDGGMDIWFYGYCTNERIIATLMTLIDACRKGEARSACGQFNIVGQEEAERIYDAFKIPRYTLV